ncbi:uncharacterized protein LOC116189155 [Punica granatum]|uniref:Uncharacterized protein LOC116189155 n=2 Tax=Punica granatum TaxID=22663 RepID=A0A6P8BW27_PUNGR|nr:uncharacterized protein LOC116189155 [Punica granatum]PKI74714.1 hypothetical protein CRG98_005041 [Punica granatum]
MATNSVPTPTPKPVARDPCKFELKKYKTVFTCYVCMVESYDTERYRCNHCDRARHKCCIQLKDAIQLKPGPNLTFINGFTFTLKPKPHTAPDSRNQEWADYCIVCGMLIKHYSYYYRKDTDRKDVNMHPGCAALIGHDGEVKPRPYELQVKEKPNCVWCGKRRPQGAPWGAPADFFCWSYKLTDGKNNRIHVHCYSEMGIQALKSIVQSDDYVSGDGRINIILKRSQNHDENILDKILKEAIKTVLELAVDPTQIITSFID